MSFNLSNFHDVSLKILQTITSQLRPMQIGIFFFTTLKEKRKKKQRKGKEKKTRKQKTSGTPFFIAYISKVVNQQHAASVKILFMYSF